MFRLQKFKLFVVILAFEILIVDDFHNLLLIGASIFALVVLQSDKFTIQHMLSKPIYALFAWEMELRILLARTLKFVYFLFILFQKHGIWRRLFLLRSLSFLLWSTENPTKYAKKSFRLYRFWNLWNNRLLLCLGLLLPLCQIFCP